MLKTPGTWRLIAIDGTANVDNVFAQGVAKVIC